VLALHGHIHESRAATQIGPTLCINPGSAYGEGVLDGVTVDIEGGQVSSYQLVSG
jgi:Icc-related predicted phosphoesterase